MRVTRRDVLGASVAAGVSVIAGCSGVMGGPDPEVVDTESNAGLSGALGGEVDVYVLVENRGDTGYVTVEIETQDANGNTINRHEQTVEIEGENSRRVDFSFSPANGVEQYRATAEAA